MSVKIETLPGHEVLALTGKTVLRPGGIEATNRLFKLANFEKGKSILELASSFGLNVKRLSHEYGLIVTGIDNKESSVERAKESISSQGISNVHFMLGDILELNAIGKTFDYILAEAILTMQTDRNKKKVITDAYKMLKPGGLLLMHELVFTSEQEVMHKELSKVIKVNANALTQEGWTKLLKDARFSIAHVETGPMSLLTPAGLLRDEGIMGILRMIKNVIMNQKIRKRVLAMQSFFSTNSDKLAHITICAKKG